LSNLLTSLPATDFRTLFESGPGLYLALTPDLSIIAVSEGYLQTTRSRSEDLLGRKVLEVFANQGANAGAVSAEALQASLARVLQTGRPDAMPVQKWEIVRTESEDGGSVEKFLRPTNSPILGADREVLYIIHRLEDAT